MHKTRKVQRRIEGGFDNPIKMGRTNGAKTAGTPSGGIIGERKLDWSHQLGERKMTLRKQTAGVSRSRSEVSSVTFALSVHTSCEMLEEEIL